MLAKQLLNYQCTEEQVNSVYLKMRSLRRMYLQWPENTIASGTDGLLAEEDISKGSSKLADEGSQFSLKMENGENCDICEDAERKDKAAASEIDSKIKKIQRKCDKRMKKLIQKHQEEIQEFHRIWEEKRVKLETDHTLESAFIRSIHGQGSVRMEKLKLLDNNFAKKMEEHHLLKYAQLKVREAEQLAAINEERHKAAHWLAKAKACSSEPSAINGPPLGSQSEDDVGGHQPSTLAKTTGPGNVQPMFGQHVADRNPSERFCPEENNVAPSSTSTSTPAEALGCGTPVAPMVDHLDQPTNSSDNGDTGLPDVPAPVEHVSDEIQSVDLSGECQLEVPKTLPSKVVEHVHPVELSNASKNEPDKGRKIALADDSVAQKDGPDGANDAAIPPAVVTTAEQLNQGVLPLGIDSVRFHVPSYHLAHPTHQPTLWNSTPCLLTDPLQNELDRMHKETELLEKNHEDTTSQLKSDCEKEIQEMINQIRKKYEVKLQESEAAFRLKRNELDKNQTKVLMNKILAEAFRSKCLDVRPPGLAGVPSSFMQHLHQVSLPPSLRSYHVAPACQPAPRQQITTPAVQTMQQLPPAVQTMLRPCSVRPSPVVGQNVASPPVQVVQNAAALFSGTSSRPPVISAITPARNLRVGGEIRSRAPHLQPFRPSVATSLPVSQSVSQLQPELMLPSQPVQPPPPPTPLPPAPRLSLTNLVSQNGSRPHGGLSTPPNPSPSTVRMVMDMDHQPPVPRIRTSSPLPEICSTFRSLELSDLESLGDVQGNQTSAVATDVVCLSDDD
ncbi:UNVERIFIED_CONTAM: hypothetical protein Scaly_0411200 [Sesamum calycinum]|uniref:MOM1 alpha-helical domain-containing protein n=1 Tax=Sesamum calycinum TaxID=2727403 RepID=A0AAW2SFU8_9LAMI